MDCARMADTVSARDLARDEAATCTEIARRAMGIARLGTLQAKRESIETCVRMNVSKKERGDFGEQGIRGGNEPVDRCSMG